MGKKVQIVNFTCDNHVFNSLASRRYTAAKPFSRGRETPFPAKAISAK